MRDAAPNLHSRTRLTALVTRPRTEAEGLAAALAERHIQPIVEPLFDIRYLDCPIRNLADVRAVLCTSANGVRALSRVTAVREVKLLAVGAATAARAAAENFVHVVSADGNVDDLVELASRQCAKGERLLHVSGSVVAGDLAGKLCDRGFRVDRVVLYDAQPASALSVATVEKFRTAAIDFVLLFSPRTAAVFAELALAANLAEALRRVTTISLSTAADAPLDRLCLPDRHIADRPDQKALLAALDQLLAERRPR